MDLRALQQAFHKVTPEKLSFGALVRTILTEEDGLIFKNGRHSKPKLLVIVGVDPVSQICYGSVLVNTKPNPNAKFSEEYRSVQYLLQVAYYPNFLRYDSFVDCGVLFAIPFRRLEQGDYFGKLNEEDSQNVRHLLETTETIPPKLKKRFGILPV
jgi:hypothetical protein